MAGFDPYLTAFDFNPLDYHLHFGIESFKSEEPTPEAGVLELRLRRRHGVEVVGTRSNGTVESLGFTEDTVSLDVFEGFNIHYHILKSPKSLKIEVDLILDYLELNPFHCDCIGPLIVSHLIDASKQYGFNNFVVAAKVDLIRTKVVHNESLARLLLDVDSKKKKKLMMIAMNLLLIWFWIRIQKLKPCLYPYSVLRVFVFLLYSFAFGYGFGN